MKEDVCRDMIRYSRQWQGKQLADLAKARRDGCAEEAKSAREGVKEAAYWVHVWTLQLKEFKGK